MPWTQIATLKGADGLDGAGSAELAAINAELDTTTPAASRADNRVFDVRKYGPTGTSNDAATFQAAIDAAATTGGGRVVAPGPLYAITSVVNVKANVHLEGNGTRILTPAGVNFVVFDIDGAANAIVSGFRIAKSAGAAATGAAYGVRVRGSASKCVVRDVQADGLVRGVQVAGQEGTTPGTVTDLTLDRVHGVNSPSNFGINIDDTNGLTLLDCIGSGNWLDGFKLRKKARNITIIGGRFNGNGVSGAGDGADCYAGGDTFVMTGVEFASNTGNGLTIKTGDLNQTDAANYGYVRNAQIASCRFIDNTATGFYQTVSNPGDLTEPVVSTVLVTNCLAQGNGLAASGEGFYTAGRNVVFSACISKANRRAGFTTTSRAIDPILIGCIAIGNSLGGAGSFNAFDLSGHGGKVSNCKAIGVDSDTVAVEGDYAALTKYHLYGFRVASTATGAWKLDGCESTYHTASGNGIRTDMASGICIITGQTTAGSPLAVATYGSIGSEVINTSATNPDDVFWVRVSGNPNVALSGWARRSQVPARTMLPTAAVQYKGQMMLKDNAGVIDDTLHVCVQLTGTSLYAWRQVTVA